MQFTQAYIPPLHYRSGGPTKADAPLRWTLPTSTPRWDSTARLPVRSKAFTGPSSYTMQKTGDYTSRINAYRFLNDNDVQLTLSSSGGTVRYKTVNLVDFMNEHSISVDDKDEVKLPYLQIQQHFGRCYPLGRRRYRPDTKIGIHAKDKIFKTILLFCIPCWCYRAAKPPG